MTSTFVSHNREDTILYIQPNNNGHRSRSWQFQLVPKYTAHDDGNDSATALPQYVVFGICDATLLELGYKHKYYARGHCVTYCHGFQFQSFCDAFPVCAPITVQYDAQKRCVQCLCNDGQKRPCINVP
eukprot:CAMPEP_0202697060 /NCGR_PEP_ID=MMETSP1385-20130828/10391_1 /ASSEMBLY_ACC=CAM_ASM_000861 /TAXON_ID=933848 /ORGANISM="Elphidium margaritaceum" /LENGTH=127 /DNA_ID=CAMNT_0049353417 /DNA_START=149 /DNA_END=528 /DNA_ORIENTATION=-